ncbi:MAG: pro-sigmaK processing inhibitor BofA family protein [Phascolarctobacterium sp.]|nr:pro-sigmaK processing inhibitor BofA family protein [Candidatus Phascolarctobacterium caballi]
MESIMQTIVNLFGQLDVQAIINGINGLVQQATQSSELSGIVGSLGDYAWIVVAVVVLFVVYKLISLPFKFVINGIIGCALLMGVNWLGSFAHFSVPINLVNALVAGIFGIPGLVGILIYYIFF